MRNQIYIVINRDAPKMSGRELVVLLSIIESY